MTKKQQIEQLKKELDSINNLSNQQWQTNQDIVRNLQTQVAQLKSTLLDNGKDSKTDLSMIWDNLIPSKYQWRYWKEINNLVSYFVGRYMKIVPENWVGNRLAIMLVLHMGFLYGNTAYNKIDNRPYYIFQEKDQYYGYLIKDLLTFDNRIKTIDNGTTIKWNNQPNFSSYQKVLLNENDIAICQPRINKIGDYIWYLQDLLELMNTKYIIVGNTENLFTPTYIKANNQLTGQYLAKEITDKTKPVKILTNDFSDLKNTKTLDLLGNKLGPIEHSFDHAENQKDLILTYKFLKEDIYNSWGIPITSAKNQSLSADANLSVSTGESIARTRDELTLDFLKQCGMDVSFDDLQDMSNIVPLHNRKLLFNENTDKNGMGINKNTNGDEIKK